MDPVELHQSRDQFLQLFFVMYIDADIAFEEAIFRLDRQGIDIELQFTRKSDW